MDNKFGKYSLIVIAVLKVTIFIGVLVYVYRKVFLDPVNQKAFSELINEFSFTTSWAILLLVLFLSILNWGTESFKWWITLRKEIKIDFWTSFKSVLSGIPVSLITPNRVGSFLGRLFYVPKGYKTKTAVWTTMTNFSQLIITIFMGMVGVFFYLKLVKPKNILVDQSVLYFSGFVFLAMLVIYFIVPKMRGKLDRWEHNKYVNPISTALEMKKTFLLRLLFLSLLRYVIFVTQFILLLIVVDAYPGFIISFITISSIYLVTTLIPSFILGNFGIREGVAITLFEPTGVAVSAVLLASLTLWIVNLLIPAIAGLSLLTVAKRSRYL